MKKNGKKLQELEDLQEVIVSYKSRGLKNLRRDIQNLYVEEMSGGGDINSLEDKAKVLYKTYKLKYTPDDNYQKKRDLEAKKLQESILGITSGYNQSDDNLLEY